MLNIFQIILHHSGLITDRNGVKISALLFVSGAFIDMGFKLCAV